MAAGPFHVRLRFKGGCPLRCGAASLFFLDEKLPLKVHESEEIQKMVIVGTGNIAWHLARAFRQSGIDITHVISRSMERASLLAADTNAIPLNDPEMIKEQPDCYLLCVTDGALPEVQATYSGKGSLVVHTSGSTGINVLSAQGNETGVFYPLQTFTKGVSMEYSHIPFLVEGSGEIASARLKRLAGKISRKVHMIDSQQRMKIHVAAVFACNFSNHLSAIADRLMQESGLSFDLLRPLVGETTRKLQSMPPSEAQTGPAVRNDLGTIEKHLESLGNKPEEQELYRLLSDNILRYTNKINE